MPLVFNKEGHKYYLDGVELPSVSTILQTEGFIDTRFFTERGRERGRLVHRIIHWHITGELDEETIDPELRGYFDGWLKLERETNFVCQAVEKPLVSDVYRFAGTPDYVGTLNGSDAVIDGKSGGLFPAAQLQLAAYSILVNSPGIKRFSLHLADTGKYKLIEHKDRSDRGVFLAALACWNWKRNNLNGRS